MSDSESTHVDATVARLADFAMDLISEWPMTGGAVALVDRDGVLATFGFGVADAYGDEPATPHHVYEIGSISKTFISLVVNQLIDERTMSLDEPVTDVLPWLSLGEGAPTVTVGQVLSHTGGLIMGSDGYPDDRAQIWSLRDRALIPDPLEHFNYSNVGYMALGQAIQARTGELVDTAMRRRIFAPLGMEGTFGRIREAMRETMAVGLWPQREDSPWVPDEALVPATWFEVDCTDGNVASSATDMAAFARLLLGDGSVDGVRLVSPEGMARLSTPTAPQGEDIVGLRGGFICTDSRYGLGVNVEVVDGRTCLTHGGGMVGYQTFILADRDAGIGVVALTNANGCYPVAQVIARAGHQLLVRPDLALPPAADAVAVADAAPVGELVGEFSSADGTEVVIAGDEAARLTVTTAGVIGRLVRIWNGRYVCDHPDLRAFRWDVVRTGGGIGWTTGPHVLTRNAADDVPALRHAALIGRYRSFSPWYPTFRIFERHGGLYLAAPGGVEAPEGDCLLVAVADGQWRIGEEEWQPSRLVAGPEVDGEVIFVYRDGHAYSRFVD